MQHIPGHICKFRLTVEAFRAGILLFQLFTDTRLAKVFLALAAGLRLPEQLEADMALK